MTGNSFDHKIILSETPMRSKICFHEAAHTFRLCKEMKSIIEFILCMPVGSLKEWYIEVGRNRLKIWSTKSSDLSWSILYLAVRFFVATTLNTNNLLTIPHNFWVPNFGSQKFNKIIFKKYFFKTSKPVNPWYYWTFLKQTTKTRGPDLYFFIYFFVSF